MMIRKILCMLLALLLLCASALADGVQLYGLYQGDKIIGTGVLMGDGQTLLTVPDAARITEKVYGADDTAYEPADMVSDGSIALLRFASPVPDTVLQLSPAVSDAALTCVGADAEGKLCSAKAVNLAPYRLNGHAAVVFTGPEGLLPGAVLLDGDNRVAGLVVASYVEGYNRYVAYTNEGLFFALSALNAAGEASSLIGAPVAPATVWLDQFKLNAEDCLLTVDWSECVVTDRAEDSVFTAFLQDVGNPFYEYSTMAAGVSSCQFPVAPGRVYAVWVRHDHGTPVLTEVPEQDEYTVFGPAPVTAFARYDYADESIWLSTVPAGEAVDDMALLPAAVALTADMLDGSQDIYLQVVSHYQVAEQADCNLYITLVDPNGMQVGLFSGFIFAPEYMERDVWHAPVSELFEVLRGYGGNNGLAAGEYTISYYLYGEMANSFTFTLE